MLAQRRRENVAASALRTEEGSLIRAALWILLIGALSAAAAGDASNGELRVRAQISDTELRCDGDSARLVLQAVYGDGSPAAGLEVDLHMDGTIAIPGVGIFEEDVVAYTDRRGRLDVRLTPTPARRNYANWWLWIDDVYRYYGDVIPYRSNSSPHIACPFGREGETSTLGLHFWEDLDGDAERDARERPLRNADVELIYDCYHCGIAGHHQRTDQRGTTLWENIWPLPVGYDGPPPRWSVCLSNEYVMSSVNGLTGGPGRCYTLHILSEGFTSLDIGVQPAPDPASIEPRDFQADCDGQRPIVAGVRVLDAAGGPVPEGTTVRFKIHPTVSFLWDSTGTTRDGYASIEFFVPAGVDGVWVEARVGAAYTRWFQPCE